MKISTILYIVIAQFNWIVINSLSIPPATLTIELCGRETRDLNLTKSGANSSVIVNFNAIENTTVICNLKVVAPKTHLIYLQFLKVGASQIGEIAFENGKHAEQRATNTPCVMSIFSPENSYTPVWKGDPCSRNSLTDVDLLTNEFDIIWNSANSMNSIKVKKFLLTAIGQGEVCKEPEQHTCMKIGWTPVICVSDFLVCNGIVNCPRGSLSTDEDKNICQMPLISSHNSWETLAINIYKRLQPPSEIIDNDKWLTDNMINEEHLVTTSKVPHLNWRNWKNLDIIETTTKVNVINSRAVSSISVVLSKYGPWGYLMLGMLICGTVLIICGLWECCFRRPKTTSTDEDLSPSIPPTTTNGQSPAVLVMSNQANNSMESSSVQQFSNIDLDQPPSYKALFPSG